MATYGTTSHISISNGITDPTLITCTPSGEITYLKAKSVNLNIDFLSQVDQNAHGRSRLKTDMKYKQGFAVTNAILVGGADVNSTTEWIMAAYIAKTPIYAILELPPAAGSSYIHKSWYTDEQVKVWYLKGVIGKLKITLTNGRLAGISLNFKEAWKP